MIEIKNVKKRYGKKEVLHDISLTIPDGEIVSLIGGSGCGKSTLLKMINRLIPITGGDIYVNGKKIAGILAETSTNFESKTIDYLILGIGLNFTQPKNDFPEELRKIASSLFEHNNSTINRNLLCAEIANNILNMISKIENYDFISEYKKRSIVLNQDIIYTSKGISLIGKAIDIANDGSLIVKNSDGSTKILNSGDITIRKVNE